LVKAAAKIKLWGQNMLWLKGEHGALLFHDLQVFFAPALPLEEVLIQQGRRYFCGWFCRIYYTKWKRIIRKHEKCYYLWF
jgi:hypothetical protein